MRRGILAGLVLAAGAAAGEPGFDLVEGAREVVVRFECRLPRGPVGPYGSGSSAAVVLVGPSWKVDAPDDYLEIEATRIDPATVRLDLSTANYSSVMGYVQVPPDRTLALEARATPSLVEFGPVGKPPFTDTLFFSRIPRRGRVSLVVREGGTGTLGPVVPELPVPSREPPPGSRSARGRPAPEAPRPGTAPPRSWFGR